MKKQMFNDDTSANAQSIAATSPSTPSRQLLLLWVYGQTSLQDHFSQVGVGPLGVNASFEVPRRQGLGQASELTSLVGTLCRRHGRESKFVQGHSSVSVKGEWGIGVGVRT